MSVNFTISETGQTLSLDKYNLCSGGDQDNETLSTDRTLVDRSLDYALFSDNKEAFLSIVHQYKNLFQLDGHQILVEACKYHALKCVATLLKGEIPVHVDINGRPPNEMFPIHYAVQRSSSITEMLLYYGAHTDVRTDVRSHVLRISNFPIRGLKLPLYLALYEIRRADAIVEWTPRDSIFKLLTSLCLPRFQEKLEIVELLAWSTNNKEIEGELFQYARDGELAQIAALLVVGRKKLSAPIEGLLKSLSLLDSCETIQKDRKEAVALLFEVFVRAGDAIEEYVKRGKNGVTVHQTIKEVACLLQEAGFALKRTDTDLTGCIWFCRQKCSDVDNRGKPEDIGMPHYGKSGHRWMTYDKPSRPCQILRRKVIGQQKIGEMCFHSQAGVGALWNAWPKNPRSLLAYARKGFLRHLIFK